MDNVIWNFTDRFDNVLFAHSVRKFLKLDLQRAETFISSYKDSMKIDISALKEEACIVKNIIEKKKKKHWKLV